MARILKFVGIMACLIGFTMIAGAFLTKDYYAKKNEALMTELEAKIKYLASLTDNTTRTEEKKRIEEELSQEDAQGIGLLYIKSLNIKTPITEGTDKEALRYSIGHFVGTPYPGERGNVCLAGHSSIVYNMVFSELHKIEIGELIVIKTLDNIYEYEVTSKDVVEPDRLDVLEQTEEATLTIVTCENNGTKRLIVKAALKE